MSANLKSLLADAHATIKSYDVAETRGMMNSTDHIFVDLREPTELETEGQIPNAINVPRGMLEFVLDSEGPYHNPVFTSGKTFVFYCKSGGRSALAAQRAEELGLQNVVNMRGGFIEWQKQF